MMAEFPVAFVTQDDYERAKSEVWTELANRPASSATGQYLQDEWSPDEPTDDVVYANITEVEEIALPHPKWCGYIIKAGGRVVLDKDGNVIGIHLPWPHHECLYFPVFNNRIRAKSIEQRRALAAFAKEAKMATVVRKHRGN